jgi:hypothetical protein
MMQELDPGLTYSQQLSIIAISSISQLLSIYLLKLILKLPVSGNVPLCCKGKVDEI